MSGLLGETIKKRVNTRKNKTMNVLIEIECETIADLHTHLKELQKQIRKQAKVNKANPQKDDFPAGTQLEDDNCYGYHTLDVYEQG
jgi:hypothetical protein